MKNRGKAVLAPTLACAGRLNLKEELETFEEIGVTMLHLDVMDGHYVPNLCFDIDTIKQIKNEFPFMLDVHLMVDNPQDYILPLKDAGVERISFHIDVFPHAIRLLKRLEECGMEGGIVVNPAQPVLLFKEVLPYVAFVLVMGVEPGFSGQSFLPETVRKVKELNELRKELRLEFQIEVDGGLNDESTCDCVKEGADILVSGTFGAFRQRKGLAEDYLDCQRIMEEAGAKREKGEGGKGKNEDSGYY